MVATIRYFGRLKNMRIKKISGCRVWVHRPQMIFRVVKIFSVILEDIMLSKGSQTQKDMYCTISLVCKI